MAPVTSEENVRFLISCIRFSESGKINFQGVATECGIVSKGAAAKRYERLLAANNIKPSDVRSKSIAPQIDGEEEDDAGTPKPSTPKSARKKSPIKATVASRSARKAPAAKKRKLADVESDEEDQEKSIFGGGEDEDQVLLPIKDEN